MTEPYEKDESAVAGLTPRQYAVTQEGATEPAFDNEFWDTKEAGIYVDVVSGEPLFASLRKFDSGSGWPSFTIPLERDNVIEKRDTSHPCSAPRFVRPMVIATSVMCSTMGLPRPAACATASIRPPCASFPTTSSKPRVTGSTSGSSKELTRKRRQSDEDAD